MANSGIDPTHVYFLNDHPTQIPPTEILGPVVQNCPICIYMIMAMITGMNKRCSSTAIRDSNEDTLMRMCMPIMDVLSLSRFHVYGNQDGTSRAGNPRNLT